MENEIKFHLWQLITLCVTILSISGASSRTMLHATLNTGAKMPLLGYGTWQAVDNELENALDRALQIGYRHIDTATVYKNEHVIGKILQKWFVSGKLKREDIFITTKLPPFGTHPKLVSKYLQESLQKLQLSYVDMYLIHAPFYLPEDSFNENDGTVKIDNQTDLLGTWKAMESEFDAGRARAIGVSNFNESQVQRIISHARIQPSNLQVELHIYLQQKSLVDFCQKNGIVVTSFASLGSTGTFQTLLKDKAPIPKLMENEVIVAIAKKHNKTPAQILLRFLVQKNIVVIPKSTNEKRMRQNFEIFDFELTPNEIRDIANLDKGEEGRILRISQHMKGLEKHPEYPYGY